MHYTRTWLGEGNTSDVATASLARGAHNATVELNWRGSPSTQHAMEEALLFRATNVTESVACGFAGYYCALYESSYQTQLQLQRCDGSDDNRTLAHVTLGDKHGVKLNRQPEPRRPRDGRPVYTLTATAGGSSLARVHAVGTHGRRRRCRHRGRARPHVVEGTGRAGVGALCFIWMRAVMSFEWEQPDEFVIDE